MLNRAKCGLKRGRPLYSIQGADHHLRYLFFVIAPAKSLVCSVRNSPSHNDRVLSVLLMTALQKASGPSDTDGLMKFVGGCTFLSAETIMSDKSAMQCQICHR